MAQAVQDVPATLAAVLERNARAWPEVEAVGDGVERLTWSELYRRAQAAAARFRNLRVGRGQRVAVVLANQIETVVLYWACALSGCIFVGAYPRLGRDELLRLLTHCEPSLIFLSESVPSDAIPSGKQTIVVTEQRDPRGFFSPAPAGDRVDLPTIEPDDVFAIVYTSGTTGPPKGVVLLHRNLVDTARATVRALRVGPSDCALVAVQITHIFGMSATILMAAVAGARCVLMREHAAGRALDLCEWEGVTIHHGAPTMFALELAAQRRAARDLSALRTGIIAAAPTDPQLVDAIRSELHCNVEIAWGLTETSPTVTITQPDDPPDKRRTTVGRPLPNFAELRFFDVGGEFGEIGVRSPGVFAGYYRDPQLTADVLGPHGFFRTGDLGWIDDDGFLHLAGRAKEIVIRGGLHVYPREIEAILGQLEWVREVALIGVPDRVLGERTCACIVVEPSAGLPGDLLAAVRGAIAQRLADYKRPDAVLKVEELPRSRGGKLRLDELRDHAIARIAAQ